MKILQSPALVHKYYQQNVIKLSQVQEWMEEGDGGGVWWRRWWRRWRRKEEVCDGLWVRPVSWSLQVISALRGAWRSRELQQSPPSEARSEAWVRSLYVAARRRPHPSALSGDSGPLAGTGPLPPVSPARPREAAAGEPIRQGE